MSRPRSEIPLALTGSPRGSAQAPGHWRRLRHGCAALLLATFFGLPWLTWQQHQAVLVDLAARRLQFFGTQLQTESLLALVCYAIALTAALAALTTYAGRRWCGFGCPQSLLTRLFRRIEQATTRTGAARRPALLVRHAVWLGISIWTGITFVGYFSPIDTLVRNLATLQWSGWETFWACFYATATWGNAAILREQVCTYLCPYARVHSALRDQATLGIRYNARRGEPRGHHPTGQPSVLQRPRGLLNATTASDYAFRASYPAIAGVMPRFTPEQLGDCNDCGDCVSACPTALDIRTGYNSACLECGACADACNRVMAGKGFPGGLIGTAPPPAADAAARRWLRPRLLFAAVTMLAMLGAGTALL